MTLYVSSYQYYVCELRDEKEVVVVPRLWIKEMGDKWVTYWCPLKNKAKEYAIPNPRWSQYEVVKFWYKAGTQNCISTESATAVHCRMLLFTQLSFI